MYTGGLEHEWIIFPIIWMSSSQLTTSVVEVFVNNKANSSLHELTSASANNEGEQEDVRLNRWQFANLKMAIYKSFIVDLAIKNGDFP